MSEFARKQPLLAGLRYVFEKKVIFGAITLDLFVVIDTGYRTGALTDPRDPRWTRRTGVVKLTYLKAF